MLHPGTYKTCVVFLTSASLSIKVELTYVGAEGLDHSENTGMQSLGTYCTHFLLHHLGEKLFSFATCRGKTDATQ